MSRYPVRSMNRWLEVRAAIDAWEDGEVLLDEWFHEPILRKREMLWLAQAAAGGSPSPDLTQDELAEWFMWAARLGGWDALIEHTIPISPTKRRRVDLLVTTPPPVRVGRFVVEFKPEIRTRWQAKAAVAQVSEYADLCLTVYADAARAVVAAPVVTWPHARAAAASMGVLLITTDELAERFRSSIYGTERWDIAS